MRQEFNTELLARGPKGAWIFIILPFSVQKAFGSKARVAVRGTVNGFPFRSSVIPEGDGTHYLAINKQMQQGAKAGPGDTVAVVMEVDDVPRTVAVPYDLAAAWNAGARAAFDRLSYSLRKEFVDWVEEAKRPETRANRVAKSLELLAAGEHPKK